MDRSRRHTRSRAKHPNQTSEDEVEEEIKILTTRGARLLAKHQSAKLTKSKSLKDSGSELGDYDGAELATFASSSAELATSASSSAELATSASSSTELATSASSSVTSRALVDYDSADEENHQESKKRTNIDALKLLQEFGDDSDASECGDENSVEDTINCDGEADEEVDKRTSPDRERTTAKAASAHIVSDASNDQMKASKRICDDQLETSSGSLEKRARLEIDCNEDDIVPIHRKNDQEGNIEETNFQKQNIKTVQKEDIEALQTDSDAQLRKDATDDVQEFDYADKHKLDFTSDDAGVQEINYTAESNKIEMQTYDAHVQGMNSMVESKTNKMSDDANVQEVNSMVASKKIKIESNDADDQRMLSLVKISKIQIQNGVAEVIELDSEIIQMQSDTGNVQKMDVEDSQTETLEQEYDHREIKTDANTGLPGNDSLALDVANNDSEYRWECDVEEDETRSANSHNGTQDNGLKDWLDLNFASLSVDIIGLFLRRSDGVSLHPEFMKYFKNVFKSPKVDKQNGGWRFDLPLEYARALQVCVNGFRLLDCTLEASLDTGDKNTVKAEDVNQWLLCTISGKLSCIGKYYNKRARSRILSAIYNHAIDTLTFKCFPCTIPGCSNTTCVKYHNIGEKRNKSIVASSERPRKCSVPNCKETDTCKGTHTSNDVLFHHTHYLSKICHNASKTGECNFTTPCSFAHPGTPDMFYHPEWKDLYISGLEKSIVYLAGSIRNLKKLSKKDEKHLNQFRVVFITSHNGVADAAREIIRKLDGTHIKVGIDRAGKFQITTDRGAVLICTLPRILELTMKHSGNFMEMASLILDDATALLSDSQAPMLRKFLSLLPTTVKNQGSVNKVVVCSNIKQIEVLQMENLLSSKLTVKTWIPHVEKYFVPGASAGPTTSSSSIRKNDSPSFAATKQLETTTTKEQQANSLTMWYVSDAAASKQNYRPSRWESKVGQSPARDCKPSSRSAQNYAIKSSPVTLVQADRSSPHAQRSCSNEPYQAGTQDKFDDGRILNGHDASDAKKKRSHRGKKKFGLNQPTADQNMLNIPPTSINDTPQWNAMQGYGHSGVTNNSMASSSYFSANNAQTQSGMPVQNFQPPAGIMPGHNQFGLSKETRGNPSFERHQKINFEAQSRMPVQNFHPPAGIMPDRNQFGSSWQEANSSAETRGNPSFERHPKINFEAQSRMPVQNFHPPAGIMPGHNQFGLSKETRGNPSFERHQKINFEAQSRMPVQNFHPPAGIMPDHNQFGSSWQEANSSAGTRSNPSSERHQKINFEAQSGRPVQNFQPPAGIIPDHNQFGLSAETRSNPSFEGHQKIKFAVQVPNKAYPPGTQGPSNHFQNDRRSPTDRSMQGPRPNKLDHPDTRKSVQAAGNKGGPTFSSMDDKLQAVLAPVSAVESVGPAVEAIVSAARQIGANSREALALFADKDHATIFSVYFNSLEEASAKLNDTNKFVIYQRAIAFGRAILRMANRDAMK